MNTQYMTLGEYISWMFNSKSEAAYICMIITGVLLLNALGQMMSGFRRCAPRQLLHSVLTAVGVIVAFFVTEALIKEMHVFFEDSSIEELLRTIEEYVPQLDISGDIRDLLAGLDPRLEEMLLTLPVATLIAPIVFVVLNILINIVLRIVFWIVSKLVPKMPGLTSRICGMAIGFAEGLLITAIMYLPFVAVTDVMGEIVAVVDSDSDTGSELTDLYNDSVGPLGSSPVFQLTKAVGGEAMLAEFATVDLGDGEIDMRSEVKTTAVILSDFISLKSTQWNSLSEDDKDVLNHLISTIDSSDFYSEIFSGVFKTMAELIDNPAKDEGELLAALVDDMLYVFSISEKSTVGEDLNTFKELYFILSDEGVLMAFDSGSSSDDMLDILTRTDSETNATVISRLIEVVKSNPRTSPLLTTLTKLSVSIMAESMGLDENAEQLYEDIKTGVNEIIAISPDDYSTPEEYTEAVADSIEATLTEQGIELDRSVIDEMAGVASDICRENDLEELTDEQISDILLKYYDGVIALPTP